MRKARTRERAEAVAEEHYDMQAFSGTGEELRQGLRAYRSLFPSSGEVIPPGLQSRNRAMKIELQRRGFVGAQGLPSSLGASEGIVDAVSRPDPTHHSRYKDVPCSPELLQQILGLSQQQPDRQRAHPRMAEWTPKVIYDEQLTVIREAVAEGMAAIARREPAASQGTLLVRVSLDERGQLSPHVTALPMSEFQLETTLWQRGLESNRFMYTPSAEQTPTHLLQTRRDGTRAPPTLVVLGSKYRSIIREGKGFKLLRRKKLSFEEIGKAKQLAATLSAVARVLFPPPAGLRRFGAKRMAQIYNRFIKSPVNEFRGSINIARHQRTLPLKKPKSKAPPNRRRRPVRLVHDPSLPRGFRFEFSGFSAADNTLRPPFGRTFGLTPHRGVDASSVSASASAVPPCNPALSGPGVSTGIDPTTQRVPVIVRNRKRTKSYLKCERGAPGAQQGEQQQQQEPPAQLAAWQDLILWARDRGCERQGRTANEQALILQRVILSRSSWPVAEHLRESGYKAWVRKEIDDTHEMGGGLPGYEESLGRIVAAGGQRGAAEVIAMLGLLAARHGMYVWSGPEWLQNLREGRGDAGLGFTLRLGNAAAEISGWTPAARAMWETGTSGNPEAVTCFSVGKYRRGELLPVCIVLVSRTPESEQAQGNVRINPTATARAALRKLCSRITAFTQFSSGVAGNRYMLADRVRSVRLVTAHEGSMGNWIGMVVAMLSKAFLCSWICSAALPVRTQFAMHQVLWFQFPPQPFELRGPSSSAGLMYRPPLLAGEALLILNTLLLM
jgi:hypothetical protein